MSVERWKTVRMLILVKILLFFGIFYFFKKSYNKHNRVAHTNKLVRIDSSTVEQTSLLTKSLILVNNMCSVLPIRTYFTACIR